MVAIETVVEEPGGLEGTRVVLTYNLKKYRYTLDFYVDNSDEPEISYFGVEPTEINKVVDIGVSKIRESRLEGGLSLVWISPIGEVIGDVFLPDERQEYECQTLGKWL
jgi:hypothetical protein